MAEQATIARPYARAAFEHAQAQGSFAQWSDALSVAATVVSDQEVAKLLGNPKVSAQQLVDFIIDVGAGRVPADARNFLLTLAENGRLALAPAIVSIYEKLRADVENVADVELVSAVTLTDAQQQRLAAALKKRLKRDVRLHCSVDASLVGGAVIRAGDFVIDGSLKSRLDRLATELSG